MTHTPELRPLGQLSRNQQRTIVTISGVVLIGLAVIPQLPFMKWSFTYGFSHGFESGKSSLNNSWVIIMLVIDLSVLAAWLYFRPRNPAWVIAPPIIMLICMFIAIPLAFVLSILIHFFMSI